MGFQRHPGRKKFVSPWIAALLSIIASASVPLMLAQAPKTDSLQAEESRNYYNKWLNEDVVYVITDEEREIFLKLATEDEKEGFIEQFWRRRDPDLKTSVNEFKEEHYRRIAYANEHFTSGRPGWKSDRGRIYITHGPPIEVRESFGGNYDRPLYEGGGTTSTYPFITWRYRHIDDIGEDIELEFVDSTLTGDYKLAKDPWEKDAFANVPNIGLTLAEERGLASKRDRFRMDGGAEYYPMLALRAQDRAFARLERYAGVMRPQEIKYPEMKEVVGVNISYNTLPFRIHQDHFRLNEQSCIVPITLEVANRNLTFKDENGTQKAKLVIYGVVSGLTNEILKEFEEELVVAFPPAQLAAGLKGTSLFQKVLILEQGRRVKFDLVLKDQGSGNVGVLTRALSPPSYNANELMPSSLVFSDTISVLKTIPESDEPFILGDVKVRPSLDHVFRTDKLMGVYFQLYNVGIDQQTARPSLKVNFRLLRGGNELMKIEDHNGESIQFFSSQRVVLTRAFSTRLLGAGKYRLTIEVFDQIKNESAILSEEFEVVATPPATTG